MLSAEQFLIKKSLHDRVLSSVGLDDESNGRSFENRSRREWLLAH